MRYVLALMLMISPVLADDWSHFRNPRFGLTIEIPPGFAEDTAAPANGDGATYHSPDGAAELKVWGANLVQPFKDDNDAAEAAEKAEGWTITYERGVNPDLSKPGNGWQVYSGTRNGRIVYAKALSACDGQIALHFRIEYPDDRKDDFNAIVSRLAVTLRGGPALDCKSG
jgi:hypothetical protein